MARLRNQSGHVGTQLRYPLTPMITSTHIAMAHQRGSSHTACAAMGNRITGSVPSRAMRLT